MRSTALSSISPNDETEMNTALKKNRLKYQENILTIEISMR